MRISDWSSDVCSSDLLGGHARLNLGARQLGDEAVGRAHRAMIDFGERHIVELAAADDDRGVALDALHRADALAVGAVKLGAGADLFARRALGRASCRERVGQYV